MAIDAIRAALKANGFPEDLVIGIDEVSVEATNELMKQTDLVVATGGAGMLRLLTQAEHPLTE